ncbi:MAG: DUF2750 domain-containing protein [Polyangiaceae bacterium]
MNTKTQREIDAVLRLDGPARFRHFIKQVVDREETWGLWENGWALMENENGVPVLPLWPAREYAELNRVGEWARYEPAPIPLNELLEELLPRVASQGALLGVFPTPAGKGVALDVEELSSALRAYEVENYG